MAILALTVLLCLCCDFSLVLSNGNDYCSVANLDCTENGESVELKITLNKSSVSNITTTPFEEISTTFSDCADVFLSGQHKDGVYTIKPTQLSKPIQVYCDMTEDGGGWTKLMRRQDGSVNFAQRWEIYKRGFGEASGEYWIGNDKISALTRQRIYMLRIRLWSFDNVTRYADYDGIEVEPEMYKYRLHIGQYSGDAGDSLSYHNNQKFSTIDQDNDAGSSHCGQFYSAGGLWFNGCYRGCPTCLYSHSAKLQTAWQGIVWKAWLGGDVALERVEMKIRPVDFIGGSVIFP